MELLKSEVYKYGSCTLDELQIAIREWIANIPGKMAPRVFQNVRKLLTNRIREYGHNMGDVVFHITAFIIEFRKYNTNLFLSIFCFIAPFIVAHHACIS